MTAGALSNEGTGWSHEDEDPRPNTYFEQLLEFAPDGVIGVDRDGRIVLANRRAEELFGYGHEELMRRRVEELVPGALRDIHRVHRATFHQDPRTRPMGRPGLQLSAQRKDGSEFACEISLAAVDTPQGTVALAAVRDMTERERIEAALRLSEQQRTRTLAKMVQVQDEERSRIAAELHDDTIQVMTAAMLSLEVVSRHVHDCGDERGERLVAAAYDTLAEAIERTRRMTFDLRPQLLEAEGIGPAVSALARADAAEGGFAVSLDIDVGRHPPELESVVYRTVREALANARRHSRASRVLISLHELDGHLHGAITDDGIGFDLAAALERARSAFHVGIDTMEERVGLTGGMLEIATAPGHGTEIRFTVPIGSGH